MIIFGDCTAAVILCISGLKKLFEHYSSKNQGHIMTLALRDSVPIIGQPSGLANFRWFYK
jgi:hypothetical protein